MDASYIKLGIATLLPVLAAVILHFLDTWTAFGKLNKAVRQIIFGIVFGGFAILGTEWGIPINGAQVNCRDGAVLIAGLMFGAPAGIIAGVIGGLERWIAVAWGVGSFTRVACSVSTVIAGIYSAMLRKLMFDDKRPGWALSFAVGVVMEIFHLTMVFLTNMGTPARAMEVVHACTMPMVIANGLAVLLAAMSIALVAKESIGFKRENIRIAETIQRWLLLSVVLAFLATSLFVFQLQTKMATAQTDSLLELALDEVEDDVRDASNQNILDLTKTISRDIGTIELSEIKEKYDVAEINLIDKNGIITETTVPEYVGFDMKSGSQSEEFLCLLGDETEFVQDYRSTTFDAMVMRKYAGVSLPDGGFVQIGYDAGLFQKDIAQRVRGISKNRHIGESGYIFILNGNYDVVSAPPTFPYTSMSKEAGILHHNEDETFETTMVGEKCLARLAKSEGYYIIALQPEDEALRMRNIAVYVNTFMEILVFAVLFGLVYILIHKIVVNRIDMVNGSLSKIKDGDLSEKVDVRTNEEFAVLSDDINEMVDALRHAIDKDLEMAKNIQASALPNVFPAFPKRKDMDIYAMACPAKEVGGDFYDLYMTGTDTLHFLIADVSGKGIPAAMFMMRAKTELKSRTEGGAALNEVFTSGNAALCEGNDAGMFVTAWQGSVDLQRGLLHYVNAGHNPPLICHADGRFDYLKSPAGFVLAGMDGVKYKLQELQLSAGDTVFLYTDGVTEATNAENELYGEDRLLEAVNSREFSSAYEMCQYVKSDVEKFVGKAPQFDDITMLAFRYIDVPTIHIENAKIEDITRVTDFIDAELEKIDCPMKAVVQLNIAIDEIFSNIVKYGYAGKSGPITVKLIEREHPHMVYLRFSDEGVPYNPMTKEDPDTTLSAEEREIGGLGIFMVKKSMDDMMYKYENDQNIFTIAKKI